MSIRNIDCSECGFLGKLTYKEGDFNKADISYCPACGGDVSEVYNLSDEDLDGDLD